ncbi:MAG TPA: hypothetical protein VF624_10415 [Tepidisphaeraceae bacterium]|jgi:lipid A disaccharide synthetase
MPKRVFITVGEVSGDNHAAELVAALRRLAPDVVVEGVGGPKMAAAGCKIHFETVANAAMSFHAVKRVAEIRRLEKWLRERYAWRTRPDLHVCVDSSGFNLRLARLAKAAGVPVLYYVAPQLWASRPGRIKKMRACVDRLACIFPFEERWFRERGITTQFVGHPLFDALPEGRLSRTAGVRWPARPPVIGVVAGSRRSEVRENFPGLLAAMKLIAAEHPGARFVLPTTPAGHALVEAQLTAAGLARIDAIAEQAGKEDQENGTVGPARRSVDGPPVPPPPGEARWGRPAAGNQENAAPPSLSTATDPGFDRPHLTSPGGGGTGEGASMADAGPALDVLVKPDAFDELIPQCDLVLCKSGTSTVHVAAYGVPMIVVYRVSTVLWQAAGRWLIKTPKIAMVNILAGGRELVPEYIPWNGDPRPIAQRALELLADPTRLALMRQDLLALVRPFDQRGASTNVARMAIEMLNAGAAAPAPPDATS